MSAEEALETALYTKLSDSLTGVTGIFSGKAPQGQAFPYVVFTQVSGVTDDTCDRDGLRFQYDVKAVSDEPWPKEAMGIAAQIDAALHKATLTVTGWHCVQVRRVAWLKHRDPDERWLVGATFQILLQEA